MEQTTKQKTFQVKLVNTIIIVSNRALDLISLILQFVEVPFIGHPNHPYQNLFSSFYARYIPNVIQIYMGTYFRYSLLHCQSQELSVSEDLILEIIPYIC